MLNMTHAAIAAIVAAWFLLPVTPVAQAHGEEGALLHKGIYKYRPEPLHAEGGSALHSYMALPQATPDYAAPDYTAANGRR